MEAEALSLLARALLFSSLPIFLSLHSVKKTISSLRPNFKWLLTK